MNSVLLAKKTAAPAGVALIIAGLALGAAPAATAGTPAPATAGCHVTTVYYGTVNHYVGIVQKKLHLTADNVFGPDTRAAVKRFQRAHGLTADGVVGGQTWAKLGGFPGCPAAPPKSTSHRTLYYGLTGADVKDAQSKLNSHLGGQNITVDGVFGAGTLAQVKRFQKAYHLTADGVIGAKTWQKLDGPVQRPAPAKVTGWVTAGGAAGSYANIRSGPGTKYRVVGTYGSHVKVTGTLAQGSRWIKTSRGYVNKGTIETRTSNPASLNGNTPTGDLCKVPTTYNSPGSFAPGYTKNTVRLLRCDALAYLNAMQKAYRNQFGHYALIDLTYRDLDEQWYWYNKFGFPRAAYPGTSVHGDGLAVDFRETDKPGEEFGWGGTGQKWLTAHGAAYGFTNPFAYGTTGESYHFGFVG